MLRLVLLLILALCAHALAASPQQREAEVKAFVDEMVREHAFDREELMALMRSARFRGDIIEAMQKPAESKAWHQYRPIFVTMARSRAGAQFWEENEALLQRAEREYGVAPEIIVAIIGVETLYGRYTGRHRVLDAISTLAFGYPRRADFFRKQLEEFLLLAREEDIDLDAAKGSYAGAMGMPQFIPSSYRAYAVDFDGDGKRDLFDNKADIIGSVANYFSRHGWRNGEMVAVKTDATQAPEGIEPALKRPQKPDLTLSQLSELGISINAGLPADTPANLLRLENENFDEYWVGLQNFYVITRYNHSNLYAMAVYQLSREILSMREAVRDELVAR